MVVYGKDDAVVGVVYTIVTFDNAYTQSIGNDLMILVLYYVVICFIFFY